MPVAIMARFILFMVHPGGHSSAGVEANNLHADATFRKLDLAHEATHLPRPGRSPQVDENELLAAIVSARISEPDRVAGVLSELRVESTGHLGRLDPEEWSEMMTGMRSGGVALGSRNKLRLLVAAQSSRSHTGGRAAPSGGRRRDQAESGDEASSSRAGRPGDSPSAATQATEQESTNKATGTVFGVSGDSAPRISVSSVHLGAIGCAALLTLTATAGVYSDGAHLHGAARDRRLRGAEQERHRRGSRAARNCAGGCGP
jgi:hypothetical protein